MYTCNYVTTCFGLIGSSSGTLFKASNSLFANNIVFLRYAVDIPSYLFDNASVSTSH
jgi:hypothetical protein